MNVWKRQVFLLCMLGVVFLSACGRTETAVQEKETVYKASNIIPEGMEGVVTSFDVMNDRIYLYTIPWETTSYDEERNAIAREQDEEGCIYSMQMDGSDVKEMQMPAVEGVIEDVQIVCGEKDVWLWITQKQDNRYRYAAVNVQEDGTEKKRLELTEVLELEEDDFVEKLLLAQGDKLVAVTGKKLVVLDTDGKKIGEAVPQSGFVQSVACTKDGDVISADVMEDKIVVEMLDVVTCKWKDYMQMEAETVLNSNLLMDGAEYDFYYRDNSGVYGCMKEGKKTIKVMDYAASNVYTENVNSICPVGGEKMLGIADARNTDGARMILYTKVSPEDVTEKITLTYAAVQMDSSLKDAIATFNHTNTKYQIQIKEYYMENDPEEKLALDLVSGAAPDLISLAGMSMERYVEKGVLEDLTPYLENDEEISEEDLIPSVSAAMKTDGKYYYMSPGFRIVSLIGKTSIVGENSGWTLEEFVAFMEKNPDVQLLHDSDKSDLLNLILSENISSFVDWKNGTCHFDAPQFKKLVEQCNQYEGKEMEYEPGQEIEMLQKGEILLTPVVIGAENMQVYDAVYKDEVTYKGYPSEEGNGSFFTFPIQVSMTTASQNKEGAWEFLRTLMMKNYQGNHVAVMDGEEDVVPTRNDAFEMYQRVRMTTEPFTDEFNASVVPMDLIMSYDSQEIPLEPMSEQEMERFVELINDSSQVISHEGEIQAIVEEEAQAYFEGTRSLDKTIDIIQDRCTKYVNENR